MLMSEPDPSNSAPSNDLAQAKTLLEKAIEILSRSGKALPAAHAQMALDSMLEESSRLDPRLPE
jgi:hypothetical protein